MIKKSGRKITKALTIVVGIAIVLFILSLLSKPANAPTDGGDAAAQKNLRTLYEGYVEIEPTTLAKLTSSLAQGCRLPCVYQETVDPFDEQPGFEIFPKGQGLAARSFFVTENRVYAVIELPGMANPDAYQAQVRRDMQAAGITLQLKENSWTIVKTTALGI